MKKTKQNRAKKTPKFETPHEKAVTVAKVKKTKTEPAKKAERDAWGGRIGTRMSAINLVVINAGTKGATVQEVATVTKETAAIVSAQLGWMAQQKKVATREQEKAENGKTAFRYFTK
jgi:hypothetical protein